MIRTLIFISAFFVFIYSNNEEISKKIIGHTDNGTPIYCSDLSQSTNKDIYSICVNENTNSNNHKTMITFNTFLNIKNGWNIVGIAHNIENTKEFLSKDCILHARKFENDVWQEYNALDGTNTIDAINSNDAIYIYSTKECKINSYGARTFNQYEIQIQNLPNLQTQDIDTNTSTEIEIIENNEVEVEVDDNIEDNETKTEATEKDINTEDSTEQNQETNTTE